MALRFFSCEFFCDFSPNLSFSSLAAQVQKLGSGVSNTTNMFDNSVSIALMPSDWKDIKDSQITASEFRGVGSTIALGANFDESFKNARNFKSSSGKY